MQVLLTVQVRNPQNCASEAPPSKELGEEKEYHDVAKKLLPLGMILNTLSSYFLTWFILFISRNPVPTQL